MSEPRDPAPSPYPVWSETPPAAPSPAWLGGDAAAPVPEPPPPSEPPPAPREESPPPAGPDWGEEPAPPPASEPAPPHPPPDPGPRPRLFGPQPDSLRNREPPPPPEPRREPVPSPEPDGFWDETPDDEILLDGEPPPWDSDEPPPRFDPALDDLLGPHDPDPADPEGLEPEPEPPGTGGADEADGGPGAVIRDSMRRNMGEAAAIPGAPGHDHFVEAARALSAESRILAGTVEGLQGMIEASRPLFEQLPEVERALRTNASDFARWRSAHRSRWGAVVLVLLGLLVPMAFGLGIAAQQHLQLLPPHDPSLGWAGHIWRHYGEELAACVVEAGRAESGLVECSVKVRGK